jgi:hypothetical protein
VLATTTGLVACGSSSPKDQVRHAWAELKHAVVAGDARGLCALLSDEARALLIAEASTLAPASTCEAAATTTFDVARDARAKAAGAKLTSVTVRGHEATTTDSTGQQPDNWIKVNGAWHLESAPGS